ncbi:MAG: hypothetical protein KGH54_03715 [Candidatus Micrarchaeota archaeon]|nr:hypothetical protein [Candidatus Micrarchaeota archaeon]
MRFGKFFDQKNSEKSVDDELGKVGKRLEEIMKMSLRKNNIVEFNSDSQRTKNFGTSITVRLRKDAEMKASIVSAYVGQAIEALGILESERMRALLEHTNSASVDELMLNLNRLFRMYGDRAYRSAGLSRRDYSILSKSVTDMFVVPEILMINSSSIAFQQLFTADYITKGNKKKAMEMAKVGLGMGARKNVEGDEFVRSFMFMVGAQNARDLISHYYSRFASVHNMPESEIIEITQNNLAWGMLRLMLAVDMKSDISLRNLAQMLKGGYSETIETLCKYSERYREYPGNSHSFKRLDSD